MDFLIGGIIGYLIGSIPTGFILTKISSGIDLRNFGSTSTGATNVLRSGNKKLAFLTLLIDAVKGFSLTMLMSMFFDNMTIVFFSAICCLIGHAYPVWLKFKGGKGVATSAGIFLALSPVPAIISVIIWAIVAKLFKISSIASLALAGSFSIINLYRFLNNDCEISLFLFSIIVFGFLIFTHFENIKRLIYHKEISPLDKKDDQK